MATEPEGFAYALQYLTGEVHALGLSVRLWLVRILIVPRCWSRWISLNSKVSHISKLCHWATQPFTDTGSCSIT